MKNNKDWHTQVLELRKLADTKKISLQEIANRTGMERTSISRMFSLRYSPILSNFVAISNAIDVEITLKNKEEKN